MDVANHHFFEPELPIMCQPLDHRFGRNTARAAKERRAFDLAQGIHMLTRQPAELYSMLDRGLITPGMKADVIDVEALPLRHRISFTTFHPAVASRPSRQEK